VRELIAKTTADGYHRREVTLPTFTTPPRRADVNDLEARFVKQQKRYYQLALLGEEAPRVGTDAWVEAWEQHLAAVRALVLEGEDLLDAFAEHEPVRGRNRPGTPGAVSPERELLVDLFQDMVIAERRALLEFRKDLREAGRPVPKLEPSPGVGRLLREIRLRARMTQKQWGEAIGLTDGGVRHVEGGRSPLTLDRIFEWADLGSWGAILRLEPWVVRDPRTATARADRAMATLSGYDQQTFARLLETWQVFDEETRGVLRAILRSIVENAPSNPDDYRDVDIPEPESQTET